MMSYKGSMKLKQYLKMLNAAGHPDSYFAKATGYSTAYISRLASGQRTPSLRASKAIMEASGHLVMPIDFMEEDKK